MCVCVCVHMCACVCVHVCVCVCMCVCVCVIYIPMASVCIIDFSVPEVDKIMRSTLHLFITINTATGKLHLFITINNSYW